MPQIDRPIFGQLRPLRFRIVFDKGPDDPEVEENPVPVFIEGFGPGAFAGKGVAVANSTATDIAGVNAKINELLASLRAANIIAS